MTQDQEEINPASNLIVNYSDQKILKKNRKIYWMRGRKNDKMVQNLESKCPRINLKSSIDPFPSHMPTDKYPTFNFVGRIVGPRGRTIKEIEQKTGVKILIRGRGSMKDSNLEELRRGKPNYEHLLDKLHVILTVDGSESYCQMKLDFAEKELKILTNPEIVESAGGRDEIKKKQLNELAILNQNSDAAGGAAHAGHHTGILGVGNVNGLENRGILGTAQSLGQVGIIPQAIQIGGPMSQVSGLAYQGMPGASLQGMVSQGGTGLPPGYAHTNGNIVNLGRSPIEGTPIFYPSNLIQAQGAHTANSHQQSVQPVVTAAQTQIVHLASQNGQIFTTNGVGQPYMARTTAGPVAGGRNTQNYTAGGKMDSSLVSGNRSAGHGTSPY